jgi:integrase
MAEKLYRKKRGGRPYGSWYGWYHTVEGIRVTVNLRTEHKGDARRRLRQLAGTGQAPGRRAKDEAPRRIEDALRYLVEEANSKDWPASTLRMFEQKAGHLLRLLGDLPLTVGGFKKADVVGYTASREAEGAARETVRKELCTLRASLREAAELGWTDLDPRAVVPAYTAKYRPRKRHLSPEQAGRLMAELPPARRLWVLVAMYSGARLSEVERIDWADIDLKAKGLRCRGTKTTGSDRWLPIPAPLLRALKAVPPAERAGAVVEPWGNVRRDLHAGCDRAGIPRVSPNDLRRTYATWLKKEGVDSAVVAKLLGHTSTRMVDLVYGQLANETLAKAVATLPSSPAKAASKAKGVRSSGVAAPARPAGQKRRMGRMTKSADGGESATSVPRGGIEPPTRGFSVRCSTC